MSHNLTPAATSPAAALTAVLVPDSGDARTAASVTTPIQVLLNMCAYFYGVLTGTVAQNVAITGTLTAAGAAIFASLQTPVGGDINGGRDVFAVRNVNAGQDVNAAGFVTATSATISGDQSIGGTLVVSGYTRTRRPWRINSANGAVGRVASCQVIDMYFMPAAAAGSSIQIDDTGAIDGDTLVFITRDTSNAVTIKLPDSTTLGTIKLAGSFFWRIEVMRIGGVWQLVDSQNVVIP